MNTQPVLALHGWQDNAGTFDLLVPLLPAHISVLCIDLPGHGLSSHLPDGCYYNSLDNVIVLLMIMKAYKWRKLYLMAHSMSAILGFVFASFYPDKMGMLIGIEGMKPHQRSSVDTVRKFGDRFDKFISEDERHRCIENEPPSYTFDETIERIYNGTFQSIDRDLCKFMLARNVRRSTKYPDRYYFGRDRRLKFYNDTVADHETYMEMARAITCPYLFIKSRHTWSFEDDRYHNEVLQILLSKNNFTYFECDGTHHVHMNNPENISSVVVDFIDKFGPSSNNGDFLISKLWRTFKTLPTSAHFFALSRIVLGTLLRPIFYKIVFNQRKMYYSINYMFVFYLM